MAVLWMPLLYLVAAVCGEMSSGTGNFPLDDCSTDEMDILFLYCDDYVSWFQAEPAMYFANDIIASIKTTRVKFFQVSDTFSSSDPTVNVSSWYFSESIEEFNQNQYRGKEQQYSSVNETIRLKIHFVKRLFAEMGGVRKNATHVAVVFLDGRRLSFEESKSVPDIVQQQDTDVKIFVVMFLPGFNKHVVYLRDTIIFDQNVQWLNNQFLTMAICHQCRKGWLLFKSSNHTDTLSCYFPFDIYGMASWRDVYNLFPRFYEGSLAAVETEEELHFLKKQLSTFLKRRDRAGLGSNGTSKNSAKFAIGLERDTTRIAKRFQWNKLFSHVKHRPLVVNHWLPGEPSGGSRKGCGSWQFDWNRTRDDAENHFGEGDFVDGWVDVGCGDKINNFGLIEIVFSRRAHFLSKIIIKPAADKIVKQALARGNLLLSRKQIVSVSVNVGNENFRKQIGNESFPLFDCGVGIPDPRYISYLFVCDEVNHCSNRRDEMLCAVRSQEATENKKWVTQNCSGVYCGDGSCLPLQWVNDGEVDCDVWGCGGEQGGNDESEGFNRNMNDNVSCAFICGNDQCVLFSQLNDSVVNCKGPEGPLDETLGKLERADTCQNILGHPIWAPRCVYVRDGYGAVLGCRNMSHLKGCTDFECPEGYIKCPNTYCIPQLYVLDKIMDCPSGEDEESNIVAQCTGNFACWDSKVCLHPDLVCDGHPDCPHQDDEVDCHVTCPDGLRCISGTVTVLDYQTSPHLIDFDKNHGRIRFLNLTNVDLSNSSSSFLQNLVNMTVNILSNCNIGRLSSAFFPHLNSLQHLDISYNRLQNLHELELFQNRLQNIRFLNVSYNTELAEVNKLPFEFLEILDLSHTSVVQVNESFIFDMTSLKHLNLSFTKIPNIHKNTFPSRLILLTLDLRGMALKNFRKDFLNGLTVRQDLYTDSFELCCPQVRGPNIPDRVCLAPDDAISSCSYLVGVGVQRVLLWVVAVLAVLGNMTVIVYRVIWDRSVLRTGYGLFVTNLGISDFIMGVYLLIIAGADYYYRGVYVLSDKSWRESGFCSLAGFLATLSCETSTFFVFLITLDRFLVMKFPFGQIKLNEAVKMVAVTLSWVIGFLLALTPIVFQFEIYSSNAMCLGLPLTTERLVGWEFSFVVFIVLNLCLFFFIAYGQRAIFRAMSENRKTQTPSRRAQDITVAKQLSLVALSNFLCWFPVGLMGLLSLGGHEISSDVYAWITVIVLPINSAANPLLYTIPALMDKWKQFKHGGT